MGYVRQATESDLERVVHLHILVFPNFFTTELGPAFLRAFYLEVLRYERAVFLVTEIDGLVQGFAAGFLDPSMFYARLRRRRVALGLAVLPRVIRHPSLVRRLWFDYRYTGRQARGKMPKDAAEFVFLALNPDLSGKGEGKELVLRFLRACEEKGASFVYLGTDPQHNQRAISLYNKLGFELVREFTVPPGRLMYEFRYYFGKKEEVTSHA